jgi:type I restriction enzyme S subunit
MLMTTLASDMVPEYFSAYLNSRAGQAYFAMESWGSAQNNISVPILGATPIIVPTQAQQASIAEHVRTISAKFSKLDSVIKNSIHALQEYRAALITNAVTGKIDVCEHAELGQRVVAA